MPTLSNILDDSAQIEVQTNDGSVHINYYPNRVTQKMAKQLTKFNNLIGQKNRDEVFDDELLNVTTVETNKILIHLIKSWDLEETKGGPLFPLDPERWEELPVWFIDEIAKKVISSPNRTATEKTPN